MGKRLRFDRRHAWREEHSALRVLVVENEPDTAMSFAMLLDLYGFEAHVVPDGPAALRAVQADPPDVVLLDIGMPGMDGWQLAEQIRGQKNMKTPFLIAITGYGTMADQLHSTESGIDLHLVKPVDPELLRRILVKFRTVIMPDLDLKT
jgi:CheY-like chemotaxis protein